MKKEIIQKQDEISHKIEDFKKDLDSYYKNIASYLEINASNDLVFYDKLNHDITNTLTLVSNILKLSELNKDALENQSNKLDDVFNKLNVQLSTLNNAIETNLKSNNDSFSKLSKQLEENKAQDDNIAKAIEKNHELIDNSLNHVSNSFVELSKIIESNSKNINHSLDSIGTSQKETNENLANINKKFDELTQIITKNNAETTSKIDYIKRNTIQKTVYRNDFERQTIKEFKDFPETANFKEKYLNLVSGLADEDVDTLNKIIIRQQKVLSTQLNSSVDFYTPEEKHAIEKLNTEFKSNIIKIADDLYGYKNYLLPVEHFEASVFWDEHGIRKLSESSMARIKNSDILDVGGYIGDSIQVFNKYTNKKIVTFEASKINYDLLSKSIEINKLENKVIPVKVALSNKKGTQKFYYSDSSSAFTEHPVSETLSEEVVETITLDEYMKDKNYKIGLIKIDIEGAEQLFLQGAKETIAKHKPIMLVSIYHNVSDFYNIKPIIESWNLGYKFKIHKPIDHSISREILLICEPND